MGAVQLASVVFPAAPQYSGAAQLAEVDAAVAAMSSAGWCSAGASRRPIIEVTTFEAVAVVDAVECPVVFLSMFKQDTATLGMDCDRIVLQFRVAGWSMIPVEPGSWHVYGPGLNRWVAGVYDRATRLRSEAMRLITVFAVGEVLPDGRLAFSVPEARELESRLEWNF